MRLMPTLQERTQQAIDAGFNNRSLAAAATVSPGAVSQWLSGKTKSLRAESAVGLAALTGWNVKWWAEGVGPREALHPVAQFVSLSDGTVTSTAAMKLRPWRDLVRLKALPDVFETSLPDDAMAPEFPAKMEVEFERADTADFGDHVIVRLSDGSLHFRLYSQWRGGWIAAAARTGYRDLAPDEDGARVVAVMTAYKVLVKKMRT